MRHSVRCVLALAVCCVLSLSGTLVSISVARAAGTDVWTQLPLYGGSVYSIAIDPVVPSTLFAGTYAGVFRSTDGGSHWIADGLTGQGVNSIAINPVVPSTLFASTNFGVFRTKDGGANWAKVNKGLTGSGVWSLAINPETPSTLYAGTSGGVFRSVDSGDTWSAVNNGLGTPSVSCLVINPANPGALYAGTAKGVFRSVDGGGVWSVPKSVLTDVNVECIAIDPLAPTTLYAGTANGVFRSTDSATSWVEMNAGFTGQAYSLAVSPVAPTTVYAGTGSGVFRSTDGSSWTMANGGAVETHVECIVIDSRTPTTLYAGTSSGIFRSADSATTWTEMNVGLTAQNVLTFAIDPGTPSSLYVGTSGCGVFRSTDGGSTWMSANSPFANTYVNGIAIDPLRPATIYAATNKGVVRSVDGGVTWSPSGLWKSGASCIVVDPVQKKVILAGTGDGVLCSLDGGVNWAAIDLTGEQVLCLAMDPLKLGTVYAGVYTSTNVRISGAVRSTDGGWTWKAIRSGLDTTVGTLTVPLSVSSFVINPTTPSTLYACCPDYAVKGGLYRSIDGGDRWTATGFAGHANPVLAIDPLVPSTLYAGANDGVFRSSDGGDHWTAVSTGLIDRNVHAIAIDPVTTSTLYVATNAGVFKYGAASSYSLLVDSFPSGSGVVARSPDAQSYTPDTIVTLTATPADGYTFAGWSGDLKGAANPATITITGNKSVTATFSALPTYMLLTPSAGSGGTITPGTPQSVVKGGSRTFVITPDSSHHIANVMVDGVSQGIIASYMFSNVTSNHTISATFAEGRVEDRTKPVVTFDGETGGIITVSKTLILTGTVSERVEILMVNGIPALVDGALRFTIQLQASTADGQTLAAYARDLAGNALAFTITVHVSSTGNGKQQTVLVLQVGKSTFAVNGTSKILDSPPVIKNGRTLVPIRAIIEALGGSVGWDGTARKATVTLVSTSLELWIGKSAAAVNGKSALIDSTNAKVVPEIINGRTMLPLRFVAENLGATVGWDQSTQTITITYQL